MQDLLDLTHFVTRLKLAPEAGLGDPLEEGDRVRARPLSDALSIPVLTRAWQMLLKGLEEVQTAPAPVQAAQMVLVRLAYAADLPVPADLVRALSDGGSPAAAASNTPSPPSGERAGVRGQSIDPIPTPSPALGLAPSGTLSRSAGEGFVSSAAAPVIAAPSPDPEPESAPRAELDQLPRSFAEVITLFDKRREAVIRSHLWSHVHLVAFEPGRIEFRPEAAAPRDLANRLGQLLGEWTGSRWIVAVSQAEGAPTLAEDEARRASEVRNEVAGHPLVRAVLDTFPGATIAAVRERFAAAEPTAETGAGEAEGVEEDVIEDGSTSAEEEG
jgi:DNA polymerase-3 subunit gamma/tau